VSRTVLGYLTRISDLDRQPYDVDMIEHANWENGDYVIGEITGPENDLYNIETCTGEMLPVITGDKVIGALGRRAGTLQGVGDYLCVKNGHLDALTNAGLFGAYTSLSQLLSKPISLLYRGHIVRHGRKVQMSDFAVRSKMRKFAVPTILIIGTSMSAGKTVTGTLACEILAASGLEVTGAKLTGAGRYRDILSFQRAGASAIYDFVDAGLPSTIVPEDEFRAAIRPLLSLIDESKPDVMVAEAGASPLEPYNGAALMDELGGAIRCIILAAFDPYAVVGVQQAFGVTPDLVTGPATSTTAASSLVDKLTGLQAINVLDPASVPAFRDLLAEKLDMELS
jgi:hypothetical protein